MSMWTYRQEATTWEFDLSFSGRDDVFSTVRKIVSAAETLHEPRIWSDSWGRFDENGAELEYFDSDMNRVSTWEQASSFLKHIEETHGCLTSVFLGLHTLTLPTVLASPEVTAELHISVTTPEWAPRTGVLSYTTHLDCWSARVTAENLTLENPDAATNAPRLRAFLEMLQRCSTSAPRVIGLVV